MKDYAAEAADLLLEVMPAAMRGLAAEMRNSRGNLDPAHFRLLAKLHHETVSLGELARMAGVSPATISRTVSTLEERGWVKRTPSPEDGRVVLVCLTDQGTAVLESISLMAKHWIKEQLQSLSLEDQKILYEGVSVLHTVIGEAQGSSGIKAENDSSKS